MHEIQWIILATAKMGT